MEKASASSRWQRITEPQLPLAYVGGLEEITTSGSNTTTTAYYGGIALSVNGALSYMLSDGLGSVSASVSSGGSVTAIQLYGPYGAVRYSSGTLPTSYGYTGQRADSATGLDYYTARYLDPVAGLFISGDTTLAGGLNRFAYVEGNPETWTDPTGHSPEGGTYKHKGLLEQLRDCKNDPGRCIRQVVIGVAAGYELAKGLLGIGSGVDIRRDIPEAPPVQVTTTAPGGSDEPKLALPEGGSCGPVVVIVCDPPANSEPTSNAPTGSASTSPNKPGNGSNAPAFGTSSAPGFGPQQHWGRGYSPGSAGSEGTSSGGTTSGSSSTSPAWSFSLPDWVAPVAVTVAAVVVVAVVIIACPECVIGAGVAAAFF